MSGGIYKVLAPVSTEPITLNDAKAWMRIDFSDDDSVIASLITRARGFVETVTGKALATQTIQTVFTIARPEGGELSGPIDRGPNWYQYQEALGSNPFGASQFYFDLPMSPVQGDESTVTVETRITAFDPWKTFPLITNSDGSKNMYLDTVQEPARLYFQSPITANFWRFTYTSGYSSSYSLHTIAPDIEQCLLESIAFFYDQREAEDLPMALKQKLLAKRVATAWI